MKQYFVGGLVIVATLGIAGVIGIESLRGSFRSPEYVRLEEAKNAFVPAATSTSLDSTEINPQLAPQAGGILVDVSGAVLLTRDGVTKPAPEGIELIWRDVIETTSGTAAIVWPHYGKTHVAMATRLEVRQVFESTNREQFIVRMRLMNGKVWSRLEEPLGPDSVFDIRSGHIIADAGISSFGMEVFDSGAVRIRDLEGSVTVAYVIDRDATPEELMQGAGAIVEDVQGTIVTLAPKQAMSVQAKATMLSPPEFMTRDETSDGFLYAGNRALSREDLDIIPLAIDFQKLTRQSASTTATSTSP